MEEEPRHENEGKTEKEEERKRESTVKERSDEMEDEAPQRALEKGTWQKGGRRRLRGVFLIVFESERVPMPRDD